MTCIVGIQHDDGVTIGGDSAGVAGRSLILRADAKVFKRDDAVFGFTSSFRMGQLLRYGSIDFEASPRKRRDDLDAWMATTFIDAVRSCLKSGGYARTDSGQDSGGTFLVGLDGHLFTIESDFQIGRSIAGYNAVGCGADIALGALAVATGSPKRRARAALAAADQWNSAVAAPFTVLTAKTETTR